MEENKIERLSQANQTVCDALGSHDFRVLLKEVRKAGVYQFKNFQTEFGQPVNAGDYHQLCRYCIGTSDNVAVTEFENTLVQIAQWLKEVI